jgi:hypothetical protein
MTEAFLSQLKEVAATGSEEAFLSLLTTVGGGDENKWSTVQSVSVV